MYNRYEGNSGRVFRVEEEAEPAFPAEDPGAASSAPERGFSGQGPGNPPPPGESPPLSGPSPGRRPPRDAAPGEPSPLGGLHLETEDLLLGALLYLLYRETHDTEFLLILAGVLIL